MVVTSRARWLILLCVLGTVYASVREHALLLHMSMACLLWLMAEWLLFRIRVDHLARKARGTRTVGGESGRKVLWAGRPVDVCLDARFEGVRLIPPVLADVRDLVPHGVDLLIEDGNPTHLLGASRNVVLNYRIRPEHVGKLKFHGVRAVVTDLCGMFQAERFVAVPSEYRVLPMPLGANSGGLTTVSKNRNALRPPGQHRLLKSGMGSELLDIREYVTGDSPRSIAWKVTARRGQLMSKQFESEVPIRCQLMCDVSPGVRVGHPGPSAAQRLVHLAATVSQTLIANRDPVGLALFDGQHTSICPPQASAKATTRILDHLSRAFDAPPPTMPTPASRLLRPAYDLVRLRYPEELHVTPSFVGLASWPMFRDARLRQTMAHVLANHFPMRSRSVGRLLGDDQLLSHYLQRFLAEHGVPLHIDHHVENEPAADQEKIEQLATLIKVSVRRARDNELFVILADLLNTQYDLSRLTSAIRTARARFHRVMVVCAWPVDVPEPPGESVSVLDSFHRQSPEDLVRSFASESRRAVFAALRRDLGRLRVPVVPAVHEKTLELILQEMELIRGAHATR